MAKEQIKTRLVLEAITKQLDVKVEQNDIDTRIAEMAEMYGKKLEEVKDNKALIEYVKNNLKTEKTIEHLVEKAKIK